MSVLSHFSSRLRIRPAMLVVLAVALCFIALDRIALYSWGYQVLHSYRVIHRNFTDPNVPVLPLGQVRPPWILLESDPKYRSLDLLFLGSSLRPDRVTLDTSGRLTLVYFPPASAWTTWVFPYGPRASRQFYAYTLEMFVGHPQPYARLYRFQGDSRSAIEPTSSWPHFF